MRFKARRSLDDTLDDYLDSRREEEPREDVGHLLSRYLDNNRH